MKELRAKGFNYRQIAESFKHNGRTNEISVLHISLCWINTANLFGQQMKIQN
jgi:hypothetical protein